MERNHDPDIVSPGRAADAPQGRERDKTAPAETLDELVTILRKRRARIGPAANADGYAVLFTDGSAVAFEFAVIELLLEIRALLTREDPPT